MNSENVNYCSQKLINRASPRERKRGQSVRMEQGEGPPYVFALRHCFVTMKERERMGVRKKWSGKI